MARGRDATDVVFVTSFGACTLASFKVITNQVTSGWTGRKTKFKGAASLFISGSSRLIENVPHARLH
jgi:hypothetical protein